MERFDAIVVGAGPAGSAAALTLARNKFSTLLVERGKTPGAKNMFGGRIYSFPLDALLPKWRDDCPVERFVTQESMAFLDDDSSLQVTFESPKRSDGPTSFTAIRAKFDAWLAKKAESDGALLVTGSRVDEVWFDGGRVHGVVAAGDRVGADLVVIADGAMSTLVEKAGLRPPLKPSAVSVGVKETIEVPAEAIQERFNLGESEGASVVFAGAASEGLRGGGFLYTNKASLSLGLVVSSEDLSLRKVQVADLMERFKGHRAVRKLIRGGKLAEYSAHLVPELGLGMAPKLYGGGLLVAGDAAGFLINNGYTFRGVDLAIASGIAAGETAAAARDRGGFTAGNLAGYLGALEKFHVLSDLETFSRAPAYLKNPRLFDTYPKLLLDIAERVYSVTGRGQARITGLALEEAKGRVSPLRLLRDLLAGARSM